MYLNCSRRSTRVSGSPVYSPRFFRGSPSTDSVNTRQGTSINFPRRAISAHTYRVFAVEKFGRRRRQLNKHRRPINPRWPDKRERWTGFKYLRNLLRYRSNPLNNTLYAVIKHCSRNVWEIGRGAPLFSILIRHLALRRRRLSPREVSTGRFMRFQRAIVLFSTKLPKNGTKKTRFRRFTMSRESFLRWWRRNDFLKYLFLIFNFFYTHRSSFLSQSEQIEINCNVVERVWIYKIFR